MELTKHENINTFLGETLEYLQQNEALNNLMLGIGNTIKNTPGHYKEVYMATVKSNEELVLAALMTPPQKLIVYSNINQCDEAIELVVKDLKQRGIRIPGVVGPKGLAKRICDIWSKYNECDIKLEMNMRVYELREVNKDVIGEGILRPATTDDLEFVAQGMYEFQIDTGLNPNPDKEKCYNDVKDRVPKNNIFLWEVEGQVVSMAAKARSTKNGATLNLVYTPKELRGKGYASSCVGALSQHLLDSGYQFCSLLTDLANPTSNSIYMKIGYKPVGDYDGYIIEERG